ncbi:hypothetical protein JCM6882_008805 [Rhodosporidiobolus microsporus]
MPTTLRPRARRAPEPPASIKNKAQGWLHVLELPYEALANAFGGLGRLISTRQTISLLATALVICSLLSPAIILTFSPSGSPFDLSSSAITRRGRGELVWELEGMRRQGLISSEEEVCWDRITHYYEKTGRSGRGRRIRVEQVLVSLASSRGVAGSRGTIGKGVLHRAWKVQKELERRLLGGEVRGNRCLVVQGECATLSPAGWWKSEDALLQDEDVHRTLSAPPVRSGLPAPLTLSVAFVGVGRDRQGTAKSAQSLVITFFLEDEPDLPHSAHDLPANLTRASDLARIDAKDAWRQAVKDVMSHKGWPDAPLAGATDPLGLSSESRALSRHVLLKFLPHLTVDAHPRRLENIIYAIGYILVLLYVSRYIRKLRAHSKMGLLVTGIVELTASGIMSVSICWLLGWSLSLVPWNLLAFLVLTSGLDNMILVLRAIANTDMNLPVPQRMSQGLRSVGVEMTILLLVEEVMAGALLWFVEINVMREWIRFGAVVLVVDYFLELTFFSTVLSIDIQRLELADLLAQNASPAYQAVPSSASSVKASSTADSVWSIRTVSKAAWRTLRDRPAKTSTVAFLWFINLSLWAFYGSEHYLPAVCSQAALSTDRPFLAPSLSPAISRSLRLGRTADPASSSHLEVPLGAGAAFWQLVNPANVTSVQVYLEPTVSVQFFDDEALAAPESIDLLHPPGADVGPSFAKKAMLVLLPIAVVMGLLYLLLLYLLKDAELLEAHHTSEERLGGPTARRRRHEDLKRLPEAGVELVADARRRHEGDVELIASGGGATASWAGLEGKVKVQVRGADGEGPSASFTLDIPLSAEPTSLVALAIDGEGCFCAAATSKGRLLVWSLEQGGALVDFGASAPTCAPIVSLVASPREENKPKPDDLPTGTPAPPVSRSKVEEKAAQSTAFFTLHRDGRVARWDCKTRRAVVVSAVAQPPEGVARRWLVPRAESDASPFLAVASKDGRLVLLPSQPSEAGAAEPSVLQLGEQVATVALGSFLSSGSADAVLADEEIVVSGTIGGKIHLHALSSPGRAVSIGELGSAIRQIRVAPSPARSFCPTCSDPLTDGLALLASTRSTLKIFRVFTPPTPSSLEPCACNTSDPTIVPRSRSSSTGLLGSPVMSRTLSSGVSRRFSPRKKPVTPTRPLQLSPSNLGDSPVRPHLGSRSGNGSYGSQSSSSGHNTPVAERSQPSFSPLSSPLPPPPATLRPSSSSQSLTSPEASPPTMTIPLPPAALDPLTPLSSTETASPLAHLRAVEVASIAIDERSGWEVIDGRVVGLRRARKSEGGRGWEVWSVGLGRDDAAFDEGFEEGATDLAELLEAAKGEDEPANEPLLALSPTPPHRPGSPSSLRRRNLPPADAVPPASGSTSSRRSSRAALSPSPSSTVRFSSETVDLPFSRARPVVPALGGTAIAVGLGNQVVLLQSAKTGGWNWQQSGFLGL